MKTFKIVTAWLLSISLTLWLGNASSVAQSPDDDAPAADAAGSQEVMDVNDLTEEEAAILADALQRIKMLRRRESHDPKRADSAKGEIQVERELDDARAAGEVADQMSESLQQALEQHGEQLTDAVEAWAEKFGEHAEDWAESFAEEMESWAEGYSEDWEQWAEQHGEKWEQWAEEFSGKWETWGQQFEDGQLSKEEMSDIVRENLEMIQQMPLNELYGQLAESSDKFKDLPWERLHEIEDIVRESVQHSLEGVERLNADSANSKEQQERILLLQQSLKQLNDGLSAKRADLESAAARMMDELDDGDVQQAKARAQEAQRRLAEVYERARAKQARLAQELDKARAGLDRESAQELTKTMRKQGQMKVAQQYRDQALKLRKEVAERVAIDHHEQELTSMRAEIDALRAEIDALRAKRQAERASDANEISPDE